MIEKLRICHVITRMIVGGAQENTLLTIIDHLEKGHEVVLVTGPSPGPEGELLRQYDDISGLEIVEISSLVRELSPLRDFRAYRMLKDFFAKGNFDVVHTHSSKAGVIARGAAWAVGVPFVVHTVHGQAFHRYEKPWKNRIYIAAEKWAAARCHRIYAVAQAMIDQCVAAGIAAADKYKVVYSGMKLEPFLHSVNDPVLRKKLGIPGDAIVVGAIARLFPLKGYEFLIPAAEQILNQTDKVHFLIVGDGIMNESIRQEVKNAGFEDKFSFTGLVPPVDIPRYTGIMDMLVHLSLREGLPRTVVQALASGKPAIAFNLDGSPEVIINGKTGFIVEPEQIEDVVKGVLTLAGDDELRIAMGAAGRELVKARFSWRTMGDVLSQEYFAGVARYRK